MTKKKKNGKKNNNEKKNDEQKKNKKTTAPPSHSKSAGPWWMRLWKQVVSTASGRIWDMWDTVPKKPAGQAVFETMSGWEKDEALDADIHIPDDVWIEITSAQAGGDDDEIAAYGAVAENILRWVDKWHKGGVGAVSISANDAMDAAVRAHEAGFSTTNVHIHTHPRMGVFFSSTDYSDHVEHVGTIMDTGFCDVDLFFIILDGIHALTRHYCSKDEKVSWNEGFVTIGDNVKLPRPTTTYREHHIVGGYSYSTGGHYGGYGREAAKTKQAPLAQTTQTGGQQKSSTKQNNPSASSVEETQATVTNVVTAPSGPAEPASATTEKQALITAPGATDPG